ncbi:Hypothetical protein I5071_13260 [Sandaracinus amylolyticus]|nr:Hypothetical protein I5071_13260 [Sandaracinus amylolyticus]
MRTKYLLACLALATLAGCDCSGDIDGDPRDGSVSGDASDDPRLAGLETLRLEPADATITIEGATPATQAYRAFGTFEGETGEREITEYVTFRATGVPYVGAFTGATFTSTTTNGGRARIEALANGRLAIGALRVVLRRTLDVPPTGGGPALPTDPGSLFDGPEDASRAPTLVYPNDGVVLPPNLGRVEVHWLRGPASNTLFEVAFENDVTDVRAYVRCERPAGVRDDGCIWEPTGAAWTYIAETNRGGLPLVVRVRATDDSGSGVAASSDIDLRFARDPLAGTIYYWTTSPGAIVRYDFGAAAGEAELVMGPGQTQSGSCVGCHAISRDGTKIVGSVGGQNRGGVLMYDLETYTPLWNESAGDDHVLQFSSFSPDGAQLAAVYGDDDRGAMGMFVFDVRCDGSGGCGTQLATIPNDGREVSHPAWSPQSGNWIAFTDVGSSGSTSQRPMRGAIAMVEREGAGWSAPSVLVARVDGLNRYNPDWSPDELFLTFNESTCPSGTTEDRDCNADSDPTAKVWAVPREGGAPVRMDRLSAPGVMDEGRVDLNDTFPRMAPFAFVLDSGDLGDRELMYVSFASTRAYGLRTAPGGNDESGNRGTYVWMAGVLPDAVARGDDPSFAAFALPFQDLTTSNHIAVWTTEAVGNPGPD